MVCERWSEAISAIADGEDPGVDPRLVEAHVAGCPGCRAFRQQIESVRRPFRIGAAAAMPDLSRRIVKLNALADRASWGMVRGLLAVVAVEILVLSVPALVLGQQRATSEHAARHLGAFTAAYGAALLVVAIRPARARTVLPVAATLAFALFITAVADIVGGDAPLWGEALHIPEILSVVLVGLLAVPSRLGDRPGGQLAADAPLQLRIVDDGGSDPEAGQGAG